jgi:hypothetical protein
MSGHDHLKFLNHGEKSAAAASSSSSAATLGGINLPTLQGTADVKEHDRNRSQHQKHVELVDYLKELYYDTKVSRLYDSKKLVHEEHMHEYIILITEVFLSYTVKRSRYLQCITDRLADTRQRSA